MSDVLDKIPSMTQQQLDALRKNALRILETADQVKTQLHAEDVLNRIDEQLEKRYLPGMIKAFYDVYPGGFYGEKQAEEERNYKLAASTKLKEILSQPEFEKLLEKGDYSMLYERSSQLVGMTNFIQGSFEKPQLLDKISTLAQL